MSFDSFLWIIRLQISTRYYKDVLSGQYNSMFSCDSFISSPTGHFIELGKLSWHRKLQSNPFPQNTGYKKSLIGDQKFDCSVDIFIE